MARTSTSEAAARETRPYIFRLQLLQAIGSAILLLHSSTTAHAYDPVTDCKSDLANAERPLSEAERLHDHWRQVLNQSYRDERSARDKWQSAGCDLKANEKSDKCSDILREIESARNSRRSSKTQFERMKKELNDIRRNIELINQRCSDPLPGPLRTNDETELGPEKWDEADRARITKKLDELRNVIDKWTSKIDQCEAYANAALDVSVSGGIASQLLPEHLKMSTMEASIAEAQRIASDAEKLKKLFDLGRQGSNRVCASAQTSSVLEKDHLDRARLFARGIYEGLKAQLEGAIAKLKDPLDRSGVEVLSKSLNPKKDFCKKWPNVKMEATKKIGISQWGYVLGLSALQSELKALERDITFTAKRRDIERAGEFFVFKNRLTQLVKRKDSNIERFQNCADKLHLTDLGCKKLPEDVARVDRLLAELNALERRRQEALNRLTQVLNGLQSDYAATEKAVAAGKDCIDDRAEEQQAACDPKDPECNTSPDADRRTSDGEQSSDSESASSESGDENAEPEAVAESESETVKTEPENTKAAEESAETEPETAETETEAEDAEADAARAEAAEAEAEAARAEAEAAEAEAEAARAEDETSEPDVSVTQTQAETDTAGGGVKTQDTCASEYGSGYRTVTLSDRQRVCMPDKATADARCQSQGIDYVAGQIRADGSFECVLTRTAANAWCAENNGSGYYAGDRLPDGSYFCVPSKTAANNWCKKNNSAGWYAGKIDRKGSFTCYPGKSVRTADCRRKYGRGARAGKARFKGGRWIWNCYGPKRGTTVRVGPPRVTRQPPNIRNVMPPRNCHRRPDGSLHCGSG